VTVAAAESRPSDAGVGDGRQLASMTSAANHAPVTRAPRDGRA
jgi:hypothetical protein